jgi:DNA-directed RNA polymerase alpha subunit
MPLGVIPIDSIFSPVIRVKYSVENTRVGQRTDYDKLILEIWTDGRITPDDALLQASAILRHHLDVFVNYDDGQIEFDEKPEEVSQEKHPAEETPEHERERDGAFGPCGKLPELRQRHHGRSVSHEDRG